MQSSFLNDIFDNHKCIQINKIKDYKSTMIYIIPYIGILEHTKIYSLPKIIYNKSRLLYGIHEIIEINKNINIQFDGDIEIVSKKWYIQQIKDIINKYCCIFNIPSIDIFIQIIQKTKYKKGNFIGGFASYNCIECILYNEDYNEDYNSKIKIKQILSHEILHLIFPSIDGKYSTCYNEGFLDYLSTILIFSDKHIKKLIKIKMDEYNRFKSLKNNKPLIQERPYIMGFLYGFLLEKKDIDKIINFIKQYLEERKYCLHTWKNKKYVKFIKDKLFINKYCSQYIMYNI